MPREKKKGEKRLFLKPQPRGDKTKKKSGEHSSNMEKNLPGVQRRWGGPWTSHHWCKGVKTSGGRSENKQQRIRGKGIKNKPII